MPWRRDPRSTRGGACPSTPSPTRPGRSRAARRCRRFGRRSRSRRSRARRSASRSRARRRQGSTPRPCRRRYPCAPTAIRRGSTRCASEASSVELRPSARRFPCRATGPSDPPTTESSMFRASLQDPRAPRRALAGACLALALARPAHAAGGDADTVSMPHDPGRYGIVVSATKTTRNPLDVPNGTAVVSGKDLRRTGARTLADALIDVAGLEAGGGSDNGTRVTNIGLWGLTEFDALLVTVDGVPVGGPFNPSLAQIAVDDIERIEIVKGPQGTLHGMSAFAGTVNVFTDRSTPGRGEVTLGGGDFT